MKHRTLTTAWLGTVPYPDAWSWQRRLFFEIFDGEREDTLLLLEHPHTYTLGRRSTPGDLVYDERERLARGIALFAADRGGRATYHGPGQLVGYPILALGERYDVVGYLRNLEDVLIRTAADLGIVAVRDSRHTGVWAGDDKLAAIGVKITRGITMHGFALNVSTDLTMFEGIVPCGISDRGVTSILHLTGRRPAVKQVADIVAAHFGDVFGSSVVWAHPRSLSRLHGNEGRPEVVRPTSSKRERPAAAGAGWRGSDADPSARGPHPGWAGP